MTATKQKRNTITSDIGKERLTKIEKMAADLGVNKSTIVTRALDELLIVPDRTAVRRAYERICSDVVTFGKIFHAAMMHMGSLAQKIGELQNEGKISDEAGAALFASMGQGPGAEINMEKAVSIVPEIRQELDNYELRNPALWPWPEFDRTREDIPASKEEEALAYIDEMHDFLKTEQAKLREILAHRENLRNVIAGILQHRNGEQAEKIGSYDEISDVAELEKLAAAAGQVIDRRPVMAPK